MIVIVTATASDIIQGGGKSIQAMVMVMMMTMSMGMSIMMMMMSIGIAKALPVRSIA